MQHSPADLRRTRRRRTGTLAVMTGTLALVALPAHAHDALLGSEPPDGSILTEAPDRIVLTFASPQAGIGAEVVVTDPDGAIWSDGVAVVTGTTVTQPLRAGLPSGDYLVQWRSVAADGHPVEGSLAFSLDLPEPTVLPVEPEGAIPTPTDDPVLLADAEDDAADAASRAPWLAVGALLAVVVGFALIRLSRRLR